MQWKFTGSRPVYQQIMEQIRGAIVSGAYAPGDRIPPVRELAARAQVNPNTMQRALLELEREGLLVTDSTVGRYVTRDEGVLENMKGQVIDAELRSCAARFRDLGLSMPQVAELLLRLHKEEEHGSCIDCGRADQAL